VIEGKGAMKEMVCQLPKRTGGRVLTDQLLVQKVERLTCVPGESYLAVLDALHDAAIDVVVCRNEGGAAMMAEAYGKLTGRPGICFVTRGPGATNASHGVHIAAQDSTPMILFVGQVAREMRGRGAFQEIDYVSFFSGVAKWVVEIDRAERIPELVSRAFHVAMQGRPGPVVVALPEDMLCDEVQVHDAAYAEPVETAPAAADIARLGELLKAAQRPFVVVGGSRWSKDAVAAMAAFSERWSLPVGTSFRRTDLFPVDSANFVGDVGIAPNPKLAARVKEADVLLLVGGRMSEVPSSSYTLLEIPVPRQKLVHVHPGEEEIGKVYRPTLGIHATPTAFAAALSSLTAPARIEWHGRTKQARADYLAWTDRPNALPGALQYGDIMLWLRENLPVDAIICNGAGNYAIWVHRYYRYRQFRSQLAPTSGSMGYGVPAAVMAKRQHPERPVIAFAGDGCFMMNGQEFATAVQYDLPIVVIVVDNGMYGTIRMHQEREYPGRISATSLTNPDFAGYARALGGFGATVQNTVDFVPAFERAVASGKPAILHLTLDPEAITPTATLASIRSTGQASKGTGPQC
jgi:acetolactate synthase I/II/III large subunit